MHEGRKNGEKIPRDDELNENKRNKSKNDKKIKQPIKYYQALNLPTLCNMNPRSVYNKLNEFHAFVEEEEVDCPNHGNGIT